MENQNNIIEETIEQEDNYESNYQAKAVPVSIIYYIISFIILSGGFVLGGVLGDKQPIINGIEINVSFNFRLALLVWTITLIVFSLLFAIALILHRQEKIINKLREF